MKKYLFLILMISFVWSQGTVKSVPQKHAWDEIYNGAINGAAITTSAIEISKWWGVQTLAIQADTSDAGTPGTFTIDPQIYNLKRSQWMDYYDTTTMVTVAATNWDSTWFYINYGGYDQNAWGDSVRFVLTPQSADSGTVIIDIGGQ